MTENQNSFYWRRWGAVVRANDWRWSDGRLSAAARKEASEHHGRVWQLATFRAAQFHRAPIADDLRHACHIYAFGKDMSHDHMPNSAFSRLLCLWGDGKKKTGLLIDALCLESRMHWDHPQLAAEEGLDVRLRSFPEAVVRAISKNDFGTRDWETLKPDQRLQLLMILKKKNETRRRRFLPRPAAGAAGKLQYIKKGASECSKLS